VIVLGYNGFGRSAALFEEAWGRGDRDRHRVLGHDAGAALVRGGRVVAAVEEERLTRERKTSDFPRRSIDWCLSQAGIGVEDVDLFAFPWRFDVDQRGPETAGLDEMVSKEALLGELSAALDHTFEQERLVLVPHHQAHVACGAALSGVEEAAFLVSDGRGETTSSVMGEVTKGKITVMPEFTIPLEDSLGMLYSKVTRFLGLTPNSDEYKVMALAAFADPPSVNPLLGDLLRLEDGGCYSLAIKHGRGRDEQFDEALDRAFSSFGRRDEFDFQVRVAAAVQQALEVATAHRLEALRAVTGPRELILEGGVALNCRNNSRIASERGFTRVHVSYAASDSGVALGAAIASAGSATTNGEGPYLGPEITARTAEAVLSSGWPGDRWTRCETDAELHERVSRLLADGAVIGWAQGRMELGPRALGNRSVLADPSHPGMKDRINALVKNRESYRPFAPVVRTELADEVFKMEGAPELPYMTFTVEVRTAYRKLLQAATHVDGTARVQTVRQRQNPRLWSLLAEVERRTGIPCLVNTSFNVAGEPIVCSAEEALACFVGTNIDALVLDRFLAWKDCG
jgi:carbamoyltransferase